MRDGSGTAAGGRGGKRKKAGPSSQWDLLQPRKRAARMWDSRTGGWRHEEDEDDHDETGDDTDDDDDDDDEEEEEEEQEEADDDEIFANGVQSHRNTLQ